MNQTSNPIIATLIGDFQGTVTIDYGCYLNANYEPKYSCYVTSHDFIRFGEKYQYFAMGLSLNSENWRFDTGGKVAILENPYRKTFPINKNDDKDKMLVELIERLVASNWNESLKNHIFQKQLKAILSELESKRKKASSVLAKLEGKISKAKIALG